MSETIMQTTTKPLRYNECQNNLEKGTAFLIEPKQHNDSNAKVTSRWPEAKVSEKAVLLQTHIKTLFQIP